MADLRYVLSGSDTITLSGQTADKLIRAGSGDAALLYLLALRTGGTLTVYQAAKVLGRDENEVKSAMELLDRLGLLKCDDAPTSQAAPPPSAKTPLPQDELPEYTAADIRRELENGSVFGSLVQEVQKSLGKMLTSDDLIKLFGIYDNLGLPPEVILHLVTYCVNENHRRYGSGRTPTLRYIEKAAYTWEREGVLSLEKAERYLKDLEARRKSTSDVKRVLQIRDRELSAGERRYVESWLALGFTPDVIELAYDKTLVKTGKLAWSYMDSILSSWHKKGLKTPDDIRRKDGKNAAAPVPKSAGAGTSKPTTSEIEQMRRYLEKLREE